MNAKIDQINRPNLLLLADFLEENITNKKFDMMSFRKKGNKYDGYSTCHFKDVSNCGSVGCSVGWGPFVPGLETIPSDFYMLETNNKGNLDFTKYCERVFGVDTTLQLGSIAWALLFSEQWADEDGSVEGAVKRLRHMNELTDDDLLDLETEAESDSKPGDSLEETIICLYIDRYPEVTG